MRRRKLMVPEEVLGQALPDRPPNLCPGCPHRATYYAVKIALKDLGVEGVFPTDIGCYTLGLLPPLSMADFLICMGSSISTAAGISRATGQKVVAFIGDSTFFHCRAARPGQRRAQRPRFSPGHLGQRHHRHDRFPAPSRGEYGAPGLPRRARPHPAGGQGPGSGPALGGAIPLNIKRAWRPPKRPWGPKASGCSSPRPRAILYAATAHRQKTARPAFR